MIPDESDFIVEMHEFHHLIKELENEKMIILAPAERNYFIRFIYEPLFRELGSKSVNGLGDYVTTPLVKAYEMQNMNIFFPTEKSRIYEKNRFLSFSEIEQKRKDDDFALEKRKAKRNGSVTLIIAITSLLISAASTFVALLSYLSYSTSREVIVKNLQPMPETLKVQIEGTNAVDKQK